MAMVFVFQVRAPVAEVIRGPADSGNVARLRRHLADFWHLLAVAYLAAVYAVWVLDVEGGFSYLARATVLSGLALIALRLALSLLDRSFGAIFTLSAHTQRDYPLLEERANRYVPVLRRSIQAVLVIFFALVVAEIWGAAPFEWLGSQRGQALVGRGVSIAIVLVIGVAVWEAAGAFADRMRLRHPGSTRLKTLLPFLQNALRIVLLTIAGLIVLSELGVNIAPLLAGAGVLGLAVGFGAQTLVKDVITGCSSSWKTRSPWETWWNSAAMADWWRRSPSAPSTCGTLTETCIRSRSARCRRSRTCPSTSPLPWWMCGWPIARISTRRSPSWRRWRARWRRPVRWRKTIVEPFEVVGVEALEANGVWQRGRFKKRPLGQWNVKREFYRRIKAAFDARGILIPVQQTMLYFGQDKKGQAAPLNLRSNAQDYTHPPARRRATLDGARTPGPMIEEHPGAREREEDEAPLLPR